MQTIRIGSLDVSRFIMGGNPFSGFSHQTPELDREMRHYYTTAQIKRQLREAESLGVNTFFGRADNHIVRLLTEYYDEGGTIQWFAQTCPEFGEIEPSIQNAIKGGAKGCYVHGGVMDNLLASNSLDEKVPPAIEMIKSAGMAAGIAGHDPRSIKWAASNLDVDFYMCCYYNPSSRVESAASSSGVDERFNDLDRAAMIEVIPTLSKPAIHYKILAAGRKSPEEAFRFAARHMKPNDAVCVGVFDKHKPDMLRENVELLEKCLSEL